MNDKRRAWFQIHLSTAMILMFVAGGVLWMNLQPTFEPYPSVRPYFAHWGSVYRGCPFNAVRYEGGLWVAADYVEKPEIAAAINAYKGFEENSFALPGQGVVTFGNAKILTVGLIGDVLVALSVLQLVEVLIKWFVRRREARKS